MSKNPQSKSSSGNGGEEGTPSQEKITVPPPAMYGAAVSEGDVEEATLLAKIPDELIKSIRAEEGERVGEGGLKQLFSREPVPVPARPAQSAGESDALLDMLFEDQRADDADDGVVTSAPALPGARRGASPPIPPPRPPSLPRPAAPPRSGRPSDVKPPAADLAPGDRTPKIPAPSASSRPAAPRPQPAAAAPPPPPPLPPQPRRPEPVQDEDTAEPGDRATPIPDGGDSPFEFAPLSLVNSSRRAAAPDVDDEDTTGFDDEETKALDEPGPTTRPYAGEPSAPVSRWDQAAIESDPGELVDESSLLDGQADEDDLAQTRVASRRPEVGSAFGPPRSSAPARAPESLPPLPSIPPPASVFDAEQDASAILVQSQQRDVWAARAAWLRAEAELIEDPTSRARALLPVAELYVMAGEDATARAIAAEARDLAPSLIFAHRQLRGLLMREGDLPAALDALEAETRILGTPAARCHNLALGAELSRVSLADPDGAHKRLELAARMHPADPRPHVQRFCEALAAPDSDAQASAAIAKFRLPDAPELAPLAAACAQVAAHRGALRPARGRAAPATPYEALLRARAHLRAGDLSEGLASLEPLRGTSLAPGVAWLTAALSAARKETRPAALGALRAVAAGSHAGQARRALAAQAIELGDAAAAREATLDDGDAFSPADRIVLSALAGGSAGEIEPWLDALADDPDFAPLCAAASAALSDVGGAAAEAPAPRGVRALGGPSARAAAVLGRALSREAVPAEGGIDASDAFSRAVVTYGDTAPESPLFRALSLELDLDGDRGARVARAVAALREVASERDSALAAAVIAEIAGDQRAAMSDLDRARAADPQHEGAARARAAQESGVGAARILAEHALTLEEGPRAAVLVTEAAIRLLDAGDNEEGERLLSRAAQIDPKLPVALHLGERSARARVDRDGLLEWLRTRRESATDPLERAHDLVREALLVAEADPASAASLLETAHRSRPQDIGLRELFERLAPEPPADRAAWRAERATELMRALHPGGDGPAEGDDRAATGVEAARLALEAALEHERAGDLGQAAASARQAIAAGDDALAPIALYRAAVAGHGAGELVDALIPRAREAADAAERLEIYERLAELDELGRKDPGNALLWRRSILEETPHHLPTLRRVASYLIGEGRDEELEPIALEIARVLDGPEAIAHALLSARLRLRVLPWEETLEPVQIAYRNEPRGIWALRQMAAHARAKADHALAIEADRQLIERTDRPSEAAALSVRAAKDALLAGSIEDAVAFFRHAITLVPHYLVAHLDLADALERGDDAAAAAAALESAAGASVGSEGRAHSLYAAAVLWQDKVQNAARARDVLEAVATVDPSYADVFSRLKAIYVAEGARAELAALLERRLDAVTDPAERVEMEVLRGRALADVGDAAAAKRALAAALDANPDHVEALSAFADVCAGEGDWAGAEQAWIRLARLVPDPDKQVAIYLRLGELYDEHLPNAERAELAYQEILKRAPGDVSARERLVALYKRAGDGARALEQQNVLINAAEAPEQKCRRTAELAEIYESMGDMKKAEATLLTARKTWPKDDFALGALARYYQRTEQASAAGVLLDRALADARRALSTGRFEPYLFSTVATVAELRGRAGASRIARATVAALDGRDAAMGGAGNAAGAARLDVHLAPELMTAAFRELLLKTGPLLDAAVPFDLDSIRATPLPPQHADITDLARGVGAAYGLPNLQVYVTAALGAVCVPAASSPPKIVLGQALVASPREDVRLFLIHRAVKILQTNASAFSRTAPIDLWPLLAAYLKALTPSWTPQGADAGRLREYQGRIERVMTGGVDPKLSVLAADVIGSIGNRASTLNTAINGWGNRAAFLAVGDLNIALTGIAWSGGHTNAPPAGGKDRVTWIGRNAEARDLIVFAVGDGLAEAREQLGFTE
ncbi:hypothetical protein [Sorangium sp. Soce836]|uniref:hypothetical protein n=1 Tax=Sorangium sp. So ce836 TaxID=2969250 RepID=UPI00235080FC|nr:hypothetical protein [Sorangium sp. Soce836]WCQ88212.1 hypothetical protein NQZ70_00886 [Sorangium sp. Soce836]